jgi:hypothetical protein
MLACQREDEERSKVLEEAHTVLALVQKNVEEKRGRVEVLAGQVRQREEETQEAEGRRRDALQASAYFHFKSMCGMCP